MPKVFVDRIQSGQMEGNIAVTVTGTGLYRKGPTGRSVYDYAELIRIELQEYDARDSDNNVVTIYVAPV